MNMKYKIVISILTIFLFGVVGISVFYSRKIDKYLQQVNSNEYSVNKQPKYHFFAIVKDYNEPYWIGIKKGIESMADTMKVAIEINYPEEKDNYESALMMLDIAIKSKVDGIITFAYNTPEYKKLIEEAFENGIPVVTIDTDCPGSKRNAYVGINDYEIGKKAGKMVVNCSSGKVRVGIIIENDENKETDFSNSYMEGFNDGIKGYKNIKVETIVKSDTGMLDAQKAVHDITTKHSNVNCIVCTSSLDTIGAAQYIVDFNKVGKINIIGYDDSDEILDYINKGVIYGTIVPDGLNVGVKSVIPLLEMKDEGKTSEYVQTELNVVTKKNLHDFKENLKIGENNKK